VHFSMAASFVLWYLLFLFGLLLLPAGGVQVNDLLEQGLVALQRGNLTEARNELEQAAKVDPRDAYVWSSLAETYLRLGDRDRAMSAASTAEKAGDGNPVVAHALAIFYLSASDAVNGLKFAQLAAEKKASPGNLDLLGRALILTGKTQEGTEQLGSAWQQAQADSQIAFDYADALLHQEDFTRAADVLTLAVAHHPKDAQLAVALGVARYGQRRFDEAIRLFLTTINLAPDAEQPYVFLGKMLDQAGAHLPEITADFERWLAANPKSGRAQLLLAKALLASDPQSERALDLLRKSTSLDPQNWEPHYELGVVLESKHDYNAAAEELSASAQLDPKQPMPHYHLARVYDRLGESDRAKTEREIHQRLTAPVQR
jgi:Flp pilus assembly protein TadD